MLRGVYMVQDCYIFPYCTPQSTDIIYIRKYHCTFPVLYCMRGISQNHTIINAVLLYRYNPDMM